MVVLPPPSSVGHGAALVLHSVVSSGPESQAKGRTDSTCLFASIGGNHSISGLDGLEDGLVTLGTGRRQLGNPSCVGCSP